MGTAIKHPVPDRVKPSFVIFDIRALWRSALSQSVRMSKITNDGLTRCCTGCFIDVPNSGRQRVKTKSLSPEVQVVCDLPDDDKLMRSSTVGTDITRTSLRGRRWCSTHATVGYRRHSSLAGRVDRCHTEPVLGPRNERLHASRSAGASHARSLKQHHQCMSSVKFVQFPLFLAEYT